MEDAFGTKTLLNVRRATEYVYVTRTWDHILWYISRLLLGMLVLLALLSVGLALYGLYRCLRRHRKERKNDLEGPHAAPHHEPEMQHGVETTHIT